MKFVAFSTAPFRALLANRRMLRRTVPAAIRKRYAGQVVGMFWLVLSPLLLLSLYAVIYLLIFRVRPTAMSQMNYVLYIFSGLIPFLGFSEALSTGSESLSIDRTVLLNTVFPPELLPLQAVLSSHAPTAVGLVLVSLLALVLGNASPWMLLLPFVLIMQMMFVCGVAWLLSPASLVLNDIKQILGFVSLSLMVITPIAYTLDMVPASLSIVVYLNPLSYFVIPFHEILVLGTIESPALLVAAFVLSWLSFAFGYWGFQRVKRAFFDYA